ncbi:LysR substrate-binding domain-containing protein [Herminiimonas arsenitoxidans]|uniref:LysR substrate-binding domain-containing protein n=1 Tax=Herminiimonas arsenitoxidans TaxID=1809410 RepID=UPI000970513A|nr:LysR substrate-binding domain-containing protein [Herminiimonas arsenitoxidans]
MDLKSLRLFIAVAETGSFVAAAERHHTVQSNVTAHIKKMEDEVGVQLIDRGGRVRLTSAGFTMMTYAERIIQAHDEAIALFKGGHISGSLRVGAMETTTALRLPPLLTHFHSAFPEVDLKLTTGPTADLVAGLNEGRFDCVFIAGKLENPRLYQFKAYKEELVLVSATPLTVMPSAEELASSTFLVFGQGCSYRQRVDVLLSDSGVYSSRMVDFGSLDAILGCVGAGMGYALIPKVVFDAHQHRFPIYSLALSARLGEVNTYFVAAETNTWTPALTSFSEALRLSVTPMPAEGAIAVA